MRTLLVLALLPFAAQAADTDVSPVDKVITMLEDLQLQVVSEGKAEAKTYDKFACFCKDMSEEKTASIKTGEDAMNDLTAKINQATSDRTDLDTVITEQTEIIE